MKTTIYELLGMITDGKAPKTIKSEGHYYNYDELKKDYYEGMGYNYEYLLANTPVKGLDDEVEILEEENKIPEKLDIRQEKNIKNNWKWKVYGKEHSYNISTPQKIIADKVNEICDYLKSKGE